MRIYDARFKYTPSMNTNIVSTWKKFGFKPTTEAERLARQRQLLQDQPHENSEGAGSGSVTQFDKAKRRVRSPLRVAGTSVAKD
jgi:hypothetical protein